MELLPGQLELLALMQAAVQQLHQMKLVVQEVWPFQSMVPFEVFLLTGQAVELQ